jgi:hypothetical protein
VPFTMLALTERVASVRAERRSSNAVDTLVETVNVRPTT